MTQPEAAMIMAAGRGERMRPLTLHTPKPLLKLGGKALIDYALGHAKAAGLSRIVVNAHYLGDQVEAHLSGYPHVRLQREDLLLETGGGAKRALPVLGEGPFFAFNADTVYLDSSTPALARMAAMWDDAAMDALLLLLPAGQGEAGDYDLADDHRLAYRPNGHTAGFIYRAVSLNHPRLFRNSPDGAFSLKRLWDEAERAGRLFGLVHDGECYHLSTPADLEEANRDFP